MDDPRKIRVRHLRTRIPSYVPNLSNSIKGFPLLCRFLWAWLSLHDDPATPVDWQLLLALVRGWLSNDITGHHASWKASDTGSPPS